MVQMAFSVATYLQQWCIIALFLSMHCWTPAHAVPACGKASPCVTFKSPAPRTAVAPGIGFRILADVYPGTNGNNIVLVDVYAGVTAQAVGCRIGSATGPATGGEFAFAWERPTSGVYYLSVTAYDGANRKTTSAKVSVSVTGAITNMAPLVEFVKGPGLYPAGGSTIKLDVLACDLDGSVARVDFYANGVKIAKDTAAPYQASLRLDAPTTLTAIAVDNKGAFVTFKGLADIAIPSTVTVTQTSTVTSVSITTKTSTATSISSVTLTQCMTACSASTTTAAITTKATTTMPTSTSTSPSPTATGSFTITPTATPTITESGGQGGVVLTVQGGTGVPSFTPWIGAIITANNPASDQVFDKWVVVSSPTPVMIENKYAIATKITTVGDGSVVVQATYKARSAMPFPVQTHPRLLVTVNDLPRLRQWYTPSNPMYAKVLLPALVDADENTNGVWSWSYLGGTGSPSSAWGDTGDTLWIEAATEQYAMFYAFIAMVKDDITYARKAKDMLMWMMRMQIQNNGSSEMFGSEYFSVSDRSRWYGEGFGLTYDWLQYWPALLSKQDKGMIRKVFHGWCYAQLTAYRSPPPYTFNDPLLLATAWDSINNYNSGHFRQLVYYALSFDPADDPAVDTRLSEGTVGNSVRSFIYSATGAFMYQKYATFEKPSVVAATLGVDEKIRTLGAVNGGVQAEGTEYDGSMTYVIMALIGMHTAGWDDVALSGPQMRIINSTWWDDYINAFMHSLLPAPQIYPGLEYMGTMYQRQSFGDVQWLVIRDSGADAMRLLGVYDAMVGNTARLNKVQWIGANIEPGGPARFFNRAAHVWGDSQAMVPIVNFMLYSPDVASNLNALVDPRPAMALSLYAPGTGRVYARTGWGAWAPGSATQTLFNYKCSWTGIDHQHGDGGHFELYRNGEWLTKEIAGYPSDADDEIGSSCVAHNTLCVRNSATNPAVDIPDDNLNEMEEANYRRGSQAGQSSEPPGDPVTFFSTGAGYVHATSDYGVLYTREFEWTPENNMVDVKHVSRTVLWLQPDVVMVYDRATTTRQKFKRFNLQFVSQPVKTTATQTKVTTPQGQNLYINCLLPAGPTLNITLEAAPQWESLAETETAKWHMIVEDSSLPADMRWLHVLQATNPNTAASTTALFSGSVDSDGAGSLHGAVLGTSFAAVFAKKYNSAGAASLSFTLPTAVSSVYVTGLTANAQYSVVKSGLQFTLTRGGGSGVVADQTGVAKVPGA